VPVDDLILFQKTYDFLLWFYPLIQRLPKHHRATLGKQLEKLSLSILLAELTANADRKTDRYLKQLHVSMELEKLRILIRLTKDLHFISIKQYTYIAKKINEIAKILVGWMKVTVSTDVLVKKIN